MSNTVQSPAALTEEEKKKLLETNYGTKEDVKVDVVPMTEEQLDQVTDFLKENKSEADKKMNEIYEKTEVDPDAELESEVVETPVGGDPLDFVKENKDGSIHIDLDLLEAANGEVPELDYDADNVKNAITEASSDRFNLSDEDAMAFYLCIREAKKGNKPKFKDLPESMKLQVMKYVAEAGGGPENYQMFTELMVSTFISEVEQDRMFIDIEKELNEALKIPSVMDLFFEHSHNVVNEQLPAMIAKCEEAGDTARADLLRNIHSAISDAFKMNRIKDAYLNTTRIRKACRRDVKNVKRYIDYLNLANSKTKFKMQDATGMLSALAKVFLEPPLDPDNDPVKVQFEEDDVIKFVIAVCMYCESLNPNSIVDASFMYYTMKNIITLTFVEEAKTPFAVELISNISDVIATIRDKESEFYAENPVREHKQKRSKRRHS